VDEDCGLGRRRDKEILRLLNAPRIFDMEGVNIRAVAVKPGTDLWLRMRGGAMWPVT
jgi:hypothetical protein